MSIRITDSMRYNTAVGNMFTIQRQYSEVMDKLASQKRLNRISDDAIGSSRLVDFRKTQSDIAGYQNNIDDTDSWLAMTESTLTSGGDLLAKAQELAVSQASATASDSGRKSAASNVQEIYEQLLSLANTRLGGRYLFSGSRTDTQPFTASAQGARSDDPVGAAGNAYAGQVTKAGTYTGAQNKTYVVKIVAGGTENAATYCVSKDGGKNWDAESEAGALAEQVNLGDGMTMTFATGDFAAGDVFIMRAYAAGYYQGNGEDLSVSLGKNANAVYNITGEAAFTDRGVGSVDVFQVLADLKSALDNNQPDEIAAQTDKLQAAQEQVRVAISKCGSVANRMAMAKNNLDDLDQNMATMISAIEDADIAELATQVAAKQVALQACYEVASRIQNNTILNFLD